jgi:pimeloyl-ACP methyl ester carboxylesterase
MQLFYLHGFASGPRSAKGLAFEAHYAARGVTIASPTDVGRAAPPDAVRTTIARLDLRVPSLEHLRLSAMIDTVRAAISGDTILLGSSLGGLTAARVAERDPRVVGLVLLAPAFQLLARWRQRADWADWERTGWLAIHDFAENRPARIDFAFAEDVARIDIGFPDVRVPTLILHGTRDDTVPIAHSREFAAGKRHVRLLELDDRHELIASIPRLLAETDAFLAPWLTA